MLLHTHTLLMHNSDVCMTFPEAVDAQYALETLQVDAEIQPDKIHRTLSVEGANLIVYVHLSSIGPAPLDACMTHCAISFT